MSEHRLSEIVIERPRSGMRIRLKKVTGNQKALYKFTQDVIDGEGPFNTYLIKPRHKTKRLNDHLGPVKRLLRSKVGKPWNEVHSELNTRLDANTMAGRHVLDHVSDYVAEHVEMIDGMPHYKANYRYYRQSAMLGSHYGDEFYVHPETGILCLASRFCNRDGRGFRSSYYQPSRKDYLAIDRDHHYQKIDNLWYHITLAQAPNEPVWDAVKKEMVNAPGSRYAIAKRQCNKREIQTKIQRQNRSNASTTT
jgi:hypothetical protein